MLNAEGTLLGKHLMRKKRRPFLSKEKRRDLNRRRETAWTFKTSRVLIGKFAESGDISYWGRETCGCIEYIQCE
jgi:hypothetical protein